MKDTFTPEVLFGLYIILTFVVQIRAAREFEKRKIYGPLPIVLLNLAGICWPVTVLSFAIYRIVNWKKKTSFGEFICR